MNDDEKDLLLDMAASAYAQRRSGASDAAAFTRARILATRARDRQRSVIAMAAVVLLAVGVGLPTAWAWTTGRLERWLGAGQTSERTEPSTTDREPRTSDAPHRARPSIEPVEERSVEPSTAPSVIAPPPPPSSTTMREERATRGARPTDDHEADGPPVDPAERRAYRAAHALHFEAHDAAAALAAWDRYLAAYPEGRFAIEARYNRALCLVRLDRREEARTALAPFAAGRHGQYRQREASALVAAMGE